MKKIFALITVLIIMLIPSATYAVSGDTVPFTNLNVSTLVSRINTNSKAISMSEPAFYDSNGPDNTSVYKSKVYKNSSYIGSVNFFVNKTGYVYIAILTLDSSVADSEDIYFFNLFDSITCTLAAAGLDNEEQTLAIDSLNKHGGEFGAAKCKATSREVTFYIDNVSGNLSIAFAAMEL